MQQPGNFSRGRTIVSSTNYQIFSGNARAGSGVSGGSPCHRVRRRKALLRAGLILPAGLLIELIAATAPAGAQETQGNPAPAKTPPAQPVQGQEVVVSAQRSDVRTEADRTSFDISRNLQAQSGTLADALRTVPGVEVDLQGQVSLRGDPGVTILIDGRPSAVMQGEGRANTILTMPASQVERVEVITNPSASMSPEGSAGVINLITKGVRKDTTSTTIRATTGGEGRHRVSVNGAMSRGKLTLTGDLAYGRFSTESSLIDERTRTRPDGFVEETRQTLIQTNRPEFASARVGAEYDISSKDRLSASAAFQDGDFRNARTGEYVSNDPLQSFSRDDAARVRLKGHDLQVSWRRELPGKEHNVRLELGTNGTTFDRHFEATIVPAAGGTTYERIDNAFDQQERRVTLDYNRPLGDETKLNLGFEGRYRDDSFANEGARGFAPGSLVPVPGLTNIFEFSQDVSALYATVDFRVGELTAKPGLRLEQAAIAIDQLTDDVLFENDYFRAYPTLHLSYELGKGHALRASFSRRIQRPSPQDLNPYVIYIDQLNSRRGNPNLLPETTDSYELGWQLRKPTGLFLSVTGFWRDAEGGITDLVEDLGGTYLTTRANLAGARRRGVEAIASGKLGKEVSFNLSATLTDLELDLRATGFPAVRRGTTASVRGTVTWQASKKDLFQLNGFYNGKQFLPQGFRTSNPVLNVGYNRKLNDRFGVSLSVQDALATGRQRFDVTTAAGRSRVVAEGPGRIALLSLSYNLGGPNPRKKPDQPFDFDQGTSGPG